MSVCWDTIHSHDGCFLSLFWCFLRLCWCFLSLIWCFLSLSAGLVKECSHLFGHPIGWVFPLGRVWQYLIMFLKKDTCYILSDQPLTLQARALLQLCVACLCFIVVQVIGIWALGILGYRQTVGKRRQHDNPQKIHFHWSSYRVLSGLIVNQTCKTFYGVNKTILYLPG